MASEITMLTVSPNSVFQNECGCGGMVDTGDLKSPA